MEINLNGATMVDFLGFGPSAETVLEDIPTRGVSGRKASDLRGVYITDNVRVTKGNLLSMDQDIKSEQIYKLNAPEKYYQMYVEL